MPPPRKTTTVTKITIPTDTENTVVKTINTRNSGKAGLSLQNSVLKKEVGKLSLPISKRKAVSPIKEKTLKRSALGNITNAIEKQCHINSAKKATKKPGFSTLTKATVASTAKITQSATTKLILPSTITSETSAQSVKPVKSSAKLTRPLKPPVETKSAIPPHQRRSARRSTLESTDSSLYVSALSDILDVEETSLLASPAKDPASEVKPSINIDEEYIQDPFQCAIYAHDIFEYLKKREVDFPISDYMKSQLSLTEHYRAVLVDWMVEVQENFELNHEALYLGVKLVDTYLSNVKVKKEFLQLVGATAMLIAAKYDERIPPSIEDILYICDGSYRRKDVTKMEVNILRAADFQLGFPLSYRFLRRYARCAKVQMPLLTLARYILEYTLMDYSTIRLSDSKMAAAALYLAFKMKDKKMQWDDTLIHFSGYRVEDFIDVAHKLNNFLHQKPRQSLQTVRNKYFHSIFYEVAKTPLISNEELS